MAGFLAVLLAVSIIAILSLGVLTIVVWIIIFMADTRGRW